MINEKRQVRLGETVVVGSDNNKSLDWPSRCIIKLIPCKEGSSREGKNLGVLLWSIQLIYPLDYFDIRDHLPVAEASIVEFRTDEVTSQFPDLSPRIE